MLEELICKLTTDKPGDINYVLSKIVWQLFDRNPRYTTANTLIGVLEAVKLQFYRRKVIPYEMRKCHNEGDIQ